MCICILYVVCTKVTYAERQTYVYFEDIYTKIKWFFITFSEMSKMIKSRNLTLNVESNHHWTVRIEYCLFGMVECAKKKIFFLPFFRFRFAIHIGIKRESNTKLLFDCVYMACEFRVHYQRSKLYRGTFNTRFNLT